MARTLLALACSAALLSACNGEPHVAAAPPAPAEDQRAAQAASTEAAMAEATSQQGAPAEDVPFTTSVVAELDEPWAMEFLPDGRLLVTEKRGRLRLVDVATGTVGEIDGVPEVDYGGQGGLGDVILHPGFADNGRVYLSYAEAGEGDSRGAAVARATLMLDQQGGGALSQLEVVYRQVPKMSGRGHYAHRLLFGPDGYLWISNGDRQHFDPAQAMDSNLGKIVRLDEAGGIPADNPFAEQGGVAAQVWSLGHRNPLGIGFNASGQLWVAEMGPAGGDELNRVERGGNYGYPVVSNGDHYDGTVIPDHGSAGDTGFIAPVITWTPVISPSSLHFYRAGAFRDWDGQALIGGLSSRGLVRVAIEGEGAREVARHPMGQRIRAVEQAPDGTLYVLEDEREGRGGRLLRLAPKG